MQVDFREKVQLAVDTPLEVFGEQFQCTVFVDGSRYRFIDFQTKSFLLFESSQWVFTLAFKTLGSNGLVI